MQSGLGRFDSIARNWWKSRIYTTKIIPQTAESRWMEKTGSFMGIHRWTDQSDRTPIYR